MKKLLLISTAIIMTSFTSSLYAASCPSTNDLSVKVAKGIWDSSAKKDFNRNVFYVSKTVTLGNNNYYTTVSIKADKDTKKEDLNKIMDSVTSIKLNKCDVSNEYGLYDLQDSAKKAVAFVKVDLQ